MTGYKIGQRVIITTDCRLDKEDAKGKKGTIIGNVPLHADGFHMTSPKIKLDDGDIIHGFECWWKPWKEPVGSMYL